MYTDKQHGYGHGSSLGQISAGHQAKWDAQAQMACAPVEGHAGRLAGAPHDDRGQLELAIDQNFDALNELEAALVLLRNRMAMVLQPARPEPCGVEENSARPPCSPAVGYMQVQRLRIGTLVGVVEDINARLDA